MKINYMRDVFFDTIYALNQDGAEIYIVSADLAGPGLDKFRKDFPEQFVHVGIAEQNLISVACGISLSGQKVIAYAANPFLVYRAFDQIRNCVISMKCPLTIVGLGTGFSVSECGYTHYATEDISLMSTLPKIEIINVSDKLVAQIAANDIMKCENARYIRLDRSVIRESYTPHMLERDVGFVAINCKEGMKTDLIDIILITYGYMLEKALCIAEHLTHHRLNVKVIDLYCIPYNEYELINEIGQGRVVVIEEHSMNGGVGSLLLRAFNKLGVSNKISIFGVEDICVYTEGYGSREYLMSGAGLGEDAIVQKILCEVFE